MNTQIVSIQKALGSKLPFFLVVTFIPISLFLKSGFVSVAVIWFFVLALLSSEAAFRISLTKHYLLLLPVVLYLLYCIGVLHSSNLSEAIKLIVRRVHLILIPLAFIISGKKVSNKDFHIVLLTFVICCVLASFWCYAHAIVNIIQNKTLVSNNPYQYYYFSYIPLTDPLGVTPIYLSLYVNFAIVITWVSPLIVRPLIRNLLLVYLVIFVVLIAAKIGIIGMVVYSLWFVLWSRRSRYPAYLTIPVIIAAIVFAVYQFPFLKQRFVTATEFDYGEKNGMRWNSTTLRLAIWSSALKTIQESPVVGYGTGDAQAALERGYERMGFVWGNHYRTDPTVTQYNAHNEFISATLEVGVAGFLVLSFMITSAFVYALRRGDSIAVGFLIIVLLAFMVECVLFRQKGIVFFTFFYSFLFWRGRTAD